MIAFYLFHLVKNVIDTNRFPAKNHMEMERLLFAVAYDWIDVANTLDQNDLHKIHVEWPGWFLSVVHYPNFLSKFHDDHRLAYDKQCGNFKFIEQ